MIGYPTMARASDPIESHVHDAAVPKGARMQQILRRLDVGGRQTYTTLCDFGQRGGPAANRTLLTQLEREGLVVRDGRIGAAAAFVLTAAGRARL